MLIFVSVYVEALVLLFLLVEIVVDLSGGLILGYQIELLVLFMFLFFGAYFQFDTGN